MKTFDNPVQAYMWGTIGLIILLGVLRMFYLLVVRPHRRTFRDKGISLSIDRTGGIVHIELDEDLTPRSLKLGRGRFDFQYLTRKETRTKWHAGTSGSVTVHNTGSSVLVGHTTAPTPAWSETINYEVATGYSLLTIAEVDPIPYFHQQWASNASVKSVNSKVTILNRQTPNFVVSPLKRWVNAHRFELVPNEKAIRKAWEQSCKRLLEACRKDPRVQSLRRDIELFDFSPAPDIRYLAIGKKGDVFVKTLAGHGEVRGLDELKAEGREISIRFSDGHQEQFHPSESQIARLHGIRRRWQKRAKTGQKSPA